MSFTRSKAWWLAKAKAEPDCIIAAGIPDVTVPSSLLFAFRQFLHAQERMLNKWAECDEAGKTQLWRDLHAKADAARLALDDAA